MGLSGISGLSGLSAIARAAVRTTYTLDATAWGYSQYYGNVYPPANPDASTGFSSPNIITTNKGYFAPNYANGVILVQFNTSSIVGTVVSASLSVVPALIERADSGNLVGEYYNWGGTPDIGDWTTSPGTNALTAYNYTALSVGVRGSIPLTGVAGINTGGNTLMRFGLDLTMSAALTLNRLQVQANVTNPIRLVVVAEV